MANSIIQIVVRFSYLMIHAIFSLHLKIKTATSIYLTDCGFIWSGREDSNFRPLAPHASALANCATPRIGLQK